MSTKTYDEKELAKRTELTLRQVKGERSEAEAAIAAAQSAEVRLHELQEAERRLTGALEALRPNGASAHVIRTHTRRGPGGAKTRVQGHRRANGAKPIGRPTGTGQRRAEVLALMADGETRSIPDIAKIMGIRDNYLYRVLPTLVKEKLLRASKKGGKTFYKATDKLKAEVAAAEVSA